MSQWHNRYHCTPLLHPLWEEAASRCKEQLAPSDPLCTQYGMGPSEPIAQLKMVKEELLHSRMQEDNGQGEILAKPKARGWRRQGHSYRTWAGQNHSTRNLPYPRCRRARWVFLNEQKSWWLTQMVQTVFSQRAETLQTSRLGRESPRHGSAVSGVDKYPIYQTTHPVREITQHSTLTLFDTTDKGKQDHGNQQGLAWKGFKIFFSTYTLLENKNYEYCI